MVKRQIGDKHSAVIPQRDVGKIVSFIEIVKEENINKRRQIFPSFNVNNGEYLKVNASDCACICVLLRQSQIYSGKTIIGKNPSLIHSIFTSSRNFLLVTDQLR